MSRSPYLSILSRPCEALGQPDVRGGSVFTHCRLSSVRNGIASRGGLQCAPSGFFRAELATVLPILSLRWLLLDFGRRGSAMDAAGRTC